MDSKTALQRALEKRKQILEREESQFKLEWEEYKKQVMECIQESIIEAILKGITTATLVDVMPIKKDFNVRKGFFKRRKINGVWWRKSLRDELVEEISAEFVRKRGFKVYFLRNTGVSGGILKINFEKKEKEYLKNEYFK